MSKIVVVGSISMDLVMRTKRIPEGGETIFGDSFNIVPGGKGANQAVAIGRLSSVEDNIYIFGNVGEDIFSADLLSNLQNNNISTEHVGTVHNLQELHKLLYMEVIIGLFIIPERIM